MSKGFTLLETLITIAVIGIVASITYPNYRKYVTRTRQAGVKKELAAIAIAQHSFQASYNTYHSDLPALGYMPQTVYLANVSSNPNAPKVRFYAVSVGPHNFSTEMAEPILLSSLGLKISGDPPRFSGEFSASDKNCTLGANAAINATGGVSPAIAQDSFVAKAIGCPGKKTAVASEFDVWTLDDNNRLTNVQSEL